MRTKSVLILASVAMILLVAGVGNAFAAIADYQNTVESELYDTGTHPAARVTSINSDNTPTVNIGDQLRDYNYYANYGNSSIGSVNINWMGSSYDGSNIIISITGSPHNINLNVGNSIGYSEVSNAIRNTAVHGKTYTYTQGITYYPSNFPWNQEGYSTNPGSVKSFTVA
jgi:hypothetical protein